MLITPAVEAAHRAAVARGQQGYVCPESGLFVFTSLGLAKRGHCCGSGCRHCPFPPEEQRLARRPGSS